MKGIDDRQRTTDERKFAGAVSSVRKGSLAFGFKDGLPFLTLSLLETIIHCHASTLQRITCTRNSIKILRVLGLVKIDDI